MSEINANLGLAKVQYPRMIFNRPRYFLFFGTGIGLSVLLAIYFNNLWFILLATPFVLALYIYTRQLKGLFYDCDVNIAKVISQRDNLYAVAMNLEGVGMPPLLAVNIARGRVPKVGTFTNSESIYFPAVCYPNYKKSPKEMDRVLTLPYTLATNDSEKIAYQHDYLMTQIEAFERCLSKVPNPFKPGLYILDSAD